MRWTRSSIPRRRARPISGTWANGRRSKCATGTPGRALERLVEHLIPLAQIAQLRADSHELLTRARAVENIAQERAERVLGQLREAVSEEIVLPVDMSKGVAGALLAHASALKKLAVQQSENADQIEKSYTRRANEQV